TYDRQLLRQALEEAGFTVERVWHDGYMPSLARSIWRRGRLRQWFYRWFDHHLQRNAKNPADATLRPHGLRPVFLRPTVVLAAARKVKSLAPLEGGGFSFA